MPNLRTTVGRLLVNSALPPDLQDYNRELDKKALTKLLQEVGRRYPEKYAEIAHTLSTIGRKAAYQTGGDSFGLAHIQASPKARQLRAELANKLAAIDFNDQLSDDDREAQIIQEVGKLHQKFPQLLLDEAIEEDNPLARQITSGARGNKNNLASLRGGDLLYTDQDGQTLPVPITRSYSEGLTPAQYWAASFGARAGLVDVKLGTAKSGFLNKQLAQAAHRLLVTSLDDDEADPEILRGLPSDADDPDNEGALLATGAGGYPRNTVITPKILADLRKQNIKKILVRSPLAGGAADGGILARDAGVRESGNLPMIGEQVGINASSAIAEPLTQSALGSKHSGGVAGTRQAVTGFDAINQQIQVPQTYRGGATHSQLDGIVQSITPAPAGGQYITIGDEKHYVLPDNLVSVKQGQQVEAGDILTGGLPNPAEIVRHKGIGEGRRYFVKTFRNTMQDSGIRGHRRNIELLARGLIDHVRLGEETGEWLPGDVVSYQTLERSWQPREGAEDLTPGSGVGQYLEKPVLHYTIGTRIQPSMLQDFDDYGVKNITVHKEPPPFQPEMVRGMANLQHDPDWITKMFGSGLKAGLLKGVHRGAKSDEAGTSFVPALAKGVDFGTQGKLKPLTPAEPAMKQSGIGDFLRDYKHYFSNPGEMDTMSPGVQSISDVVSQPVRNPGNYAHYMTHPGEIDPDLREGGAKAVGTPAVQLPLLAAAAPLRGAGLLGWTAPAALAGGLESKIKDLGVPFYDSGELMGGAMNLNRGTAASLEDMYPSAQDVQRPVAPVPPAPAVPPIAQPQPTPPVPKLQQPAQPAPAAGQASQSKPWQQNIPQHISMLEGIMPGSVGKILKHTGPIGMMGLADPSSLGRLAATAMGNYKPPQPAAAPPPPKPPTMKPPAQAAPMAGPKQMPGLKPLNPVVGAMAS